jgi:hypothetical protein
MKMTTWICDTVIRPLQDENQALKKRVALLEIQGGRIKEERDEARAHLKRIHASIAIMT